MVTRIQLLFDLSSYGERKTIEQKAFEEDFFEVMKRFSAEVGVAFEEMKRRTSSIPVVERDPRLKAVMLNGLVCGRMMKAFPYECQRRQYKRVSCRIKGTEAYFKKLNDRHFPDNAITKNVLAIKKQLQEPEAEEKTATFIGYTTDKMINNLTGIFAVYIKDDEKIWDINIYDLLNNSRNESEIIVPVKPVTPTLRTAADKKKRKDVS